MIAARMAVEGWHLWGRGSRNPRFCRELLFSGRPTFVSKKIRLNHTSSSLGIVKSVTVPEPQSTSSHGEDPKSIMEVAAVG